MQILHWLNEQRLLMLKRVKTHFVHATALFVGLSCMVWYVIPHPVIPVAIGIVPLAILITLSQPVLLADVYCLLVFPPP